MKKVLLLALLLVMSTSPCHAEKGWFPYWFPADPATAPDFQGLPASTFNAGKDVLDPPAGKHGFVKVKDGHFYFEDGTRARFWGTNLCFGACFPEHKDAEVMANRIAYFGFNAVRLHHMDYYNEPNGIFESPGKLSPRQLDKLDYLVFQLKQRGIYIDINTLVSRFFKESEGVVDADKLGMAAKPVSLFDARLIELQKQYSKDLLTHLNPYTKLRYCDDPAVCLVEITNENTLTELNPSSLPEYYRKEYDELRNGWKANQGKNRGHASEGRVPIADITAWDIEQHSGAEMSVSVSGKEVILNISNVTETNWHLQYNATGVKLKKGKSYLLTFAAKGGVPIGVVSQQAYEPWDNLGLHETFNLSKDFQPFEAPFTATEDCDNAKIGFIVGYDTGTITIKDTTFSESSKAADIMDFKAYLEKKYLMEMRAYLRDTVGIKCPLGIGGHWNPAQLKLQKECLDYVDKHGYWDHPQFPHKSWDMNDFRMHNKSMLADINLGIIGEFERCAPKNMPYVISEWMHCYPNPFAYETPVLLASTARRENWDALFQFAFTGGFGAEKTYNYIDSYFDVNSNAQQLILCSYGSRIFLKGLSPQGTVPIKIGEIKNTGSGWNSSGRFDWGTAPTLFKQP
ncbi:MAG: carbohydrate binding domain-containing protein [Candidatus Omnitrophota bacterium]|jgi:hypothetical protein